MLLFLLTLLRAIFSAAITDDDYLTLKGGRFTTKSGKTLLLQGINIGGWLLQESWMCPVNGGDWANLNSIEALEDQGFSNDQIYELFVTYQDNWFTTNDLDILADVGISLLRVPFWYRNFMLTPDGKWVNDSKNENNPGIKKLDWVVSEAGKRGIYVILDLHGCPGGQSTDHTTGTLVKNELYSTPAYLDAMEDLWVTLADRYKSNPAVAFYDIMNEPNNNNGKGDHSYDMNAQSTIDLTNSVYDRMYKAIRRVDPNHLISVEAVWRLRNLPDPASVGWENVVYQLHTYDSIEDLTTYASGLSDYSAKTGVGAYSGEFSNMDSMEVLNRFNVSWTSWTYKGGRGEQGDWFMYSKNCEAVDTTRDSFNSIKQRWGTGLRTENGFTVSRVRDAIKNAII